MTHFGFVVFYGKSEFLRKQSKLKGILAPFPWWAWILTGALLVSSSLLMAFKRESTKQ